jgi:polar amino acid transport system substrate-binding protein
VAGNDRVLRLRLLAGLAALGLSLSSGCTSADSEEPSTAPPPPEVDVESLAEFLDPCAKLNLTTVKPGALTFVTSKLPSPPLFLTEEPADREGFDSDLAYVLAEQLGFRPGQVAWEIVPAEQILSGEFVDYDIAIGGLTASQVDGSSVVHSQAYANFSAIASGAADDPSAGPQEIELTLGLVAGNPLAACVDEALIEMSEIGTLEDLRERWLYARQLD